ncbi:MAG: sarcosine oxidase subunit alpha family protein, partial [Rhizobiaceae bacterium]
MKQANRLASGGLIDRRKRLSFSFDGRKMEGYAGDTLASAMIANGVNLAGRSFKYHRPRGILTAGSEEPNALVTLGSEANADPNLKAPAVELFDGLEAHSQNRFPSLRFDLMAMNDWLSPFLGAGFYYKTFMWPASFWEKIYEPIIRRAAGLGGLSGEDDPDQYDRAWAYCDLLVIGSGPAGLQAALTAGRSGARVIICEEDFIFGGRLSSERMEIARIDAVAWAEKAIAELENMVNVRLMPRTTVFGSYDGGTYGAIELKERFSRKPATDSPRQCYWKIIAKRSVLAAGAMERQIAFGDNDRPGIMQASAVRTYVNRFAASPGSSTVIFTNNDDGWKTARDLFTAGCDVEAIVDIRPSEDIGEVLHQTGDIPHFTRSKVVGTTGRLGLSSVDVINANGRTISLPTDCLAVSGGWNPTVHLTCHQGGRPVWNDRLAAFVPGADTPQGMYVAGAANGAFSTHGALAQGLEAANRALEDLGFKTQKPAIPDAEDGPYAITPIWHVRESKGRAWLDQQNDVTVKDVQIARREGFKSVEHLKRYTTLGMATDQGKTANVTALAIMAELFGQTIPQTGTTIFRPPYVPVAISAFAGRSRGKDFQPVRLTPSHDWAKEQNASFTEAGLWLRAQWFPRHGETHWRQSCDREALAVRKSVGVCDVSTLGKIDVKGKDAGRFLDHLYCNMISTLGVGKVRYGLMLREDGFALDDGTVARLDEDHYVVTTTTGHAGQVMRHADFCSQALWPNLDVHLVSVTDQFAQFAIAGPNSRAILEKLLDDPETISTEKFPFMACGKFTICGGVPARLFRISFSGELAYELAVDASFGDALIRTLMLAGADHDISPYGLEALNVLRIEKGYPTSGELNGRTTAGDLGLGRMVSKKKDCIGKVMSQREGLVCPDRMVFAGFKPVDIDEDLSAGAHFIGINQNAETRNDEGWLSSTCFSPSLGHSIGLGFIKHGDERHGEKVRAVDLLRGTDI